MWSAWRVWKIGDPFDEKTELGPLATADAVTSLDADVQKTVKAGAKLLTGGHPLKGKGNFYAPTVLTNIPKDSPAYGEELFGPVASIFRAKDQDEAIRIANDVRFGWGRARGRTMTKSASVSSTNWKRGWSSSTRWSLQIRAFRLAG